MRLKQILKGSLVFLLCIQSNLTDLWYFSSSVFSCPAIDNFAQDMIDPFKILKSYFTNKGYETGTIKIPQLGILVELKKTNFIEKKTM